MNTENKCWKPGQIIVKAQVTESQPLKTARAESLSASGTVTLTSPFQVPVKQNTLFLTTLWQPVKTAQVRASRGYLSRVYCKRGASHHGLAETGSQGRKKALQWEREKSGERWSEAVGTGSCNGAADSVSCVIGSGCVLLFHWSRIFFSVSLKWEVRTEVRETLLLIQSWPYWDSRSRRRSPASWTGCCVLWVGFLQTVVAAGRGSVHFSFVFWPLSVFSLSTPLKHNKVAKKEIVFLLSAYELADFKYWSWGYNLVLITISPKR